MSGNQIGYIIFGIIIGLVVSYLFLWGEPYSKLDAKYKQLTQDHNQLDQNYILLQQEHNQLKQECGEVLKRYESCVGRETFFEWVNRLSSLASLAKFLGLI